MSALDTQALGMVPIVIEQSGRGERSYDIYSRLLRERLGWAKGSIDTTFQSVFGPEEWLKPYTDETIKSLPGKGIKKLAVITPGFTADCLETIEEIGEENAEYFMHAGGEKFARIDCLNDSAPGMRVLEHIVKRELMGWV